LRRITAFLYDGHLNEPDLDPVRSATHDSADDEDLEEPRPISVEDLILEDLDAGDYDDLVS
jgi:hypothetical protein